MTCERVAHPYLDTSGHRKHEGEAGGGGDATCARVDVESNVPGVPIEVSAPDDLDRQDGVTAFCRQYSETCPLPVTFTAPQFAGTGGDKEFRRWRLNGVQQPLGQLSVTINPCQGQCIDLKAGYGEVFIYLCDFCNGPDGALQLPQTMTVSSPINVGLGQCHSQGTCGFLSFHHTPVSCWNSLWESGTGSDFECEFAGLGAPPSNICAATWISSTVRHPNPDPDLPEDQCWPANGCATPAVDCFFHPQCYICLHHPQQRMRTWLMTESAVVELYIWNPPAQPDFVLMTWWAGASKTFCMKTDDDPDAACASYCANQFGGECHCNIYTCGAPENTPTARLIAPPEHAAFNPVEWTGIHTPVPFSSDFEGLNPEAPLLTERISNHDSCMAAAQHLINTAEFRWTGALLSRSLSLVGNVGTCNFPWICERIGVNLDFTLNF